MMGLLSIFLCSLCLLSLSAGAEWIGSDNIRWVRQGLYDVAVMVKLDTPGLPLKEYNHDKADFEVVAPSSAILLNFTLTPDYHTLLLNGRPFLPLPSEYFEHPHLIPAWNVPQDVSWDLIQAYTQNLTKGLSAPALDIGNPSNNHAPQDPQYKSWRALTLDYDRDVRDIYDDPDTIVYIPYPTLTLNILGADDLLLDVPTQRVIEIELKDINSTNTHDPNRSYRIHSAVLKEREGPRHGPDQLSYEHPQPHSARVCTWWYWRCGDTKSPPYFRYVWRSEFDAHGKIGSLRHAISQTFDADPHVLGWSWVRWTAVAILGAVLGLVGTHVYKLYKWLHRVPQKRGGGEGEIEAAQRLLGDEEDVEEIEGALGPRVGEYVVQAHEPVSQRTDAPPRYDDVPPTYEVATKPLLPTSAVEEDGDSSK